MENEETIILSGVLEKDAEPILSADKELGCLLTVREGGRTHQVELFSALTLVLYRHALRGRAVIIPARRQADGTLCARLAYPA